LAPPNPLKEGLIRYKRYSCNGKIPVSYIKKTNWFWSIMSWVYLLHYCLFSGISYFAVQEPWAGVQAAHPFLILENQQLPWLKRKE
jgi:hypothetical protein